MALNKEETAVLQNVVKLLHHIQSQGFDPKSLEAEKPQTRGNAIRMNSALTQAQKQLKTVVAMKGYYPKG